MKSKIIAIGTALMFSYAICHGQYFGKYWSIGIQSGIGKAGFWYGNAMGAGSRTHRTYAAGIYISKFMGNRFEPYIGFFYEEKGYVFDEIFDHSAEFLTSHLTFRYYPFKKLGLHAVFGGYGGVLVKSEDDFNKIDWGTRLGLGYKFMVYRTYGVELQAASEIGLKHDGQTRDGKHISYLAKIGVFRYF